MPFRLDVTLCLGESLFDARLLSNIETILRSETESWSSGVCIFREDERTRYRIKDFARDVQVAATARRGLHEQLVRRHGVGPYARRTGSVEIRGADEAVIVVLSLDDDRFAPSAGRWLWGNTLTVQLCVPHVGEEAAASCARRITARACCELSPWYVHGHLIEEWNQKNISQDGGGMIAVGMDTSRYLPGLYWLNFFGKPYCALIGKERMLNAPAHEAEELDSGVLLLLASDPETWDTPEYKASESRLLTHLGDKYFFNPYEPQRETVAPDFGLNPLPRNPRFT